MAMRNFSPTTSLKFRLPIATMSISISTSLSLVLSMLYVLHCLKIKYSLRVIGLHRLVGINRAIIIKRTPYFPSCLSLFIYRGLLIKLP